MFADFGVVNFWTYLLGATLIVLVPGPETLFVIKTSITSGIKRGFAAIFSIAPERRYPGSFGLVRAGGSYQLNTSLV
ncbi:hypothetical protein [Serratia bockelmannii]|uniref:hypothetical protein n=1 Tax=Serratia bockelmannii TaxID=2703793 RepID=UPI0023622DCA|nr:hypothetical protein [Serratia bockelmannii]